MAQPVSAFPRRLLVNSASIFVGEAIARLATFLMAVVIARRYGSAALGDYGYALALASVLLVVPDLGLHLFAVRELSTDKRRLQTIFWNVHWLKFLLAAFVVVFALIFGKWGIAEEARRLLFYVLIPERSCKPSPRLRWRYSKPSSACNISPFSNRSIPWLSSHGL